LGAGSPHLAMLQDSDRSRSARRIVGNGDVGQIHYRQFWRCSRHSMACPYPTREGEPVTWPRRIRRGPSKASAGWGVVKKQRLFGKVDK
jgi:hypothetical protein